MLIKDKRVVWSPSVVEVAEQPYVPAKPQRVETKTTRECRYVTSATRQPLGVEAALLLLLDVVWDARGQGGYLNPIRTQLSTGEVTYDTQYVCENVTRTTIIPPSPEVPYRAAVQGRPASVTEEFYLGWNAGAELIENISGNGYFEFSVSAAVVGAVIGLNTINSGTGYFEISHGFKCSRGKYEIHEAGTKVHPGGKYTSDTVFRIQRNGAQVRYFVDGTLVHTSGLPSASPVILDCSLYSGGDSILSASASTTADALFQPTSSFASSKNSMRGMTGVATDFPFSEAANSLNPLVGSATGARRAAYCYSAATLPALLGRARDGALPAGASESDGVMPALIGEILGRGFSVEGDRLRDLYGENYRQSSGTMLPLRGVARSGGTSQPFALSSAELSPLFGYATVLAVRTARTSGILYPLTGLSSDRVYGAVTGIIAPLLGGGADRVYLQPTKMLPMGTFEAYAGAVMNATMTAYGEPVFGLSTGVTVLEPSAARIIAPQPKFASFSGATANAGVPQWAVQFSGTVETLVRADAIAPAPIFTSEVVVGAVSRANLSLGRVAGERFGVRAYSGAVGGGHAKFAAFAIGALGVRGRFSGKCPRFVGAGSGTMGALARAELIAPALVRPQHAIAPLVLPVFELLALGYATDVDPISADYEAYVVNLGHEPTTRWQEKPVDEVTRYTNFPFSRVVRYKNDYYGVGLTGLYKLGGDKDDGVAISWSIRTAMMDFDQPNTKNLSSAYIGGRLGPQTALTLHVGERDTATYTYETPRGTTSQNHRQKFGKGNRARYYALSLSGTGVAEIDDVGLDVHTTTRRI